MQKYGFFNLPYRYNRVADYPLPVTVRQFQNIENRLSTFSIFGEKFKKGRGWYIFLKKTARCSTFVVFWETFAYILKNHQFSPQLQYFSIFYPKCFKSNKCWKPSNFFDETYKFAPKKNQKNIWLDLSWIHLSWDLTVEFKRDWYT